MSGPEFGYKRHKAAVIQSCDFRFVDSAGCANWCTCSIFNHCDLAFSLFYMSGYARKSMFGRLFAFERFYCVFAVCEFDWSS